MSPQTGNKENVFPALLEEIRAALPVSEAYLVGGAVRDSLLGRSSFDLDLTLRGDGIAAARAAANALGAACYPLDAERGVGRVILVREGTRFTLDFASLRGGDLAADLAARDFTINAIARPLAAGGSLIDPLGGERDLRAGILRACSPNSVSDDPVRAVRAVRLANQFALQLEAGTREQVRAGGAKLSAVSAERVRDEFFRILAGGNVAGGVRLLAELGLLAEILPETAGLAETVQPPPHHADVWTHTLLAVEKLEDLLAGLHCGTAAGIPEPALLRAIGRLERFSPAIAQYLGRPLSDDRPLRGLIFLAAVLHDAGKPETRSVDPLGEVHFLGHEQLGEEWTLRRAAALRFSNEETHFTARIVRHHMRPILLRMGGPITRRAVFRFFRATGPSGVAVSLFSLADTLATYGADLPDSLWDECIDLTATLLEGFFERPTEWVSPVPLLTGNDLIHEFGLAPGPQIGELMDALREAQAGGEITTREEALALAARGLGRPEK